MVPLLGAVVVCYGGVTTNFGGVDEVPLITQKLVFAIWGLCWYNFCFSQSCFWKNVKNQLKLPHTTGENETLNHIPRQETKIPPSACVVIGTALEGVA